MKMNVFSFDYDILFNESILMLMGYENRTLTSNGLSFQMTKNLMFMGTWYYRTKWISKTFFLRAFASRKFVILMYMVLTTNSIL